MLKEVAIGIITILLFVTIVVVFCILIIRLYIKKITKHNQIIFQKDIDFQKTINTTIIETQEQVLQNISQELHDDAGQQLTVINFQLENLKLDSSELDFVLSPISKSVNALSKSIRSISHSLNNQLLSQQDLIKAIEVEVNRIKENNAIEINFSHRASMERKFSSNEKIVLYRIFQEVINNILKHAKASIVTIEINSNPKFEIKITDNGCGFDPFNSDSKKEYFGIKNIYERAKIIDFETQILSEINKGTVVSLFEK